MKVRDLVFQLLLEIDVSADYAQQLRNAVHALENHVGEELQVCQLTAERINTFLAYRLETGASKSTVKNYRRLYVRILNYAADLELVPYVNTRRIRNVKVRSPCPTAWSLEDIATVYRVAESFGKEWLLYCRIAFETGLRRGDILRLRDLSDDAFAIVEHKTGLQVIKTVRPATVSLWHELGGLHFSMCYRLWFAKAKKICRTAGLHGTLSKQLRISHESHNPGGLQHRTEQARKHYLDRTVAVKATLPPEVGKGL